MSVRFQFAKLQQHILLYGICLSTTMYDTIVFMSIAEPCMLGDRRTIMIVIIIILFAHGCTVYVELAQVHPIKYLVPKNF